MTAIEKTPTEKIGVKKVSRLTIALIVLCVVFIGATIGVLAYLVSLPSSTGIASTGTLELGVAAVIIVIVIMFGIVLAVLTVRKRPQGESR